MKILNFVSNSTIKLVDISKELSEEASEIDIAVAYVKDSGLELMKNYLVGKNVRIIFTFEFLVTDPECVKKLLEMGCKCREYMGSGFDELSFHPKLYIFKRGDIARIIVGSSNLTAGGFMTNVESNIVIEGNKDEPVIKEILGWFESLWDSSKANPVAKEDIEEYIFKKREYEQRYREAERILKELKTKKGYANSVIICMSREHDKNKIYNRIIGVPERSKSLFFKWVKNGSRIFVYYINHGIAKILRSVSEPFESNDIVPEWEDGILRRGEKYPNRVHTKLVAEFERPVTLEELVELNIRRIDTKKVISTAHLRHSVVPISDADGDAIEELLREKNEG